MRTRNMPWGSFLGPSKASKQAKGQSNDEYVGQAEHATQRTRLGHVSGGVQAVTRKRAECKLQLRRLISAVGVQSREGQKNAVYPNFRFKDSQKCGMVLIFLIKDLETLPSQHPPKQTPSFMFGWDFKTLRSGWPKELWRPSTVRIVWWTSQSHSNTKSLYSNTKSFLKFQLCAFLSSRKNVHRGVGQ